jgi:hypothetical protein
LWHKPAKMLICFKSAIQDAGFGLSAYNASVLFI